MKATIKQQNLLIKLHPYYGQVKEQLSELDIKHASKLISVLLTMRKNRWNFKYLACLSDEFYDIEEQAFGNAIITPAEEW